MADITLLNDPIAAAAIATWAATSGQADALARGDAAAALLTGIWPAALVESYKASTPEQRLAVWASGDGLKNTGQMPPPEKVKAVQELYAQLYSSPKNPGVVPQSALFQSAIVLALLATAAAQANKPDAITRGDVAAKALLDNGQWNAIKYGIYLTKAPNDRVEYWRSGEGLADLQPDSTLVEMAKKLYAQEYAETQGGTKPSKGSSESTTSGSEPSSGYGTGGLIKVAAIGGGLWLISKIFMK